MQAQLQRQDSVSMFSRSKIYKSDQSHRCRHLCCREGLSKKPRASKKTLDGQKGPKAISSKTSKATTQRPQHNAKALNGPVPFKKGNLQSSQRNVSRQDSVWGNFRSTPVQREPVEYDDPEVQSFMKQFDFAPARESFEDVHGHGSMQQIDNTTHDDEYATSRTSMPRFLDVSARDSRPSSVNGQPRTAQTPHRPIAGVDQQSLPRLDERADNALLPRSREALSETGGKAADSLRLKLFMSTDPPEEYTSKAHARSNDKDHPRRDDRIGIPDNGQDDHDQQMAAKSVAKTPSRELPVLKDGLPAWAYEFGDRAFIAEWQDFVDFI